MNNLLNDDDIAYIVYMYMVYTGTHEIANSSEFHSIITSPNQLHLEATCSMLPAFCVPNLLRNFVWITPKFEKIISMEAEHEGRCSNVIARSHHSALKFLNLQFKQVLNHHRGLNWFAH